MKAHLWLALALLVVACSRSGSDSDTAGNPGDIAINNFGRGTQGSDQDSTFPKGAIVAFLHTGVNPNTACSGTHVGNGMVWTAAHCAAGLTDGNCSALTATWEGGSGHCTGLTRYGNDVVLVDLNGTPPAWVSFRSNAVLDRGDAILCASRSGNATNTGNGTVSDGDSLTYTCSLVRGMSGAGIFINEGAPQRSAQTFTSTVALTGGWTLVGIHRGGLSGGTNQIVRLP